MIAPVHPNCATCGHNVVLHNLSPSSGLRTGCSISSGEKAVPCPCKTYAEAPAASREETRHV